MAPEADVADPTKSDAFCILPWVHLEILPGGASKPCCVARDVVRADAGLLNVSRDSIDEIRASRDMRALRESLAAGRKVETCTFCWNQEARGEPSGRQQWNGNFRESVSRLSQRARAGSSVSDPLPLEYLQVSLGNTCNLACRMCNSAYSSRIAQDRVHSKWAPLSEHGGTERKQRAWFARRDRQGWLPGVPWFEQEAFLREEILGNAGSLRLLYVTGGEPLMNESFERVLDEYARAGHAPSLTLQINTNLFHNESRLARIMESLLRFGGCSLGASIDGCKAVYEYIRHPARWEIIERNLRHVRSLARQHARLKLMLNAVVQPYNCLALADLLRFADELEVECYPHVIEQPWFLKMQVVPRELRLRAAERLRAYAASAGDPGVRATNRDHALRVAHHFEIIEDEATTAAERRAFADFTRELDASRKQSLALSVPELAQILEPPR